MPSVKLPSGGSPFVKKLVARSRTAIKRDFHARLQLAERATESGLWGKVKVLRIDESEFYAPSKDDLVDFLCLTAFEIWQPYDALAFKPGPIGNGRPLQLGDPSTESALRPRLRLIVDAYCAFRQRVLGHGAIRITGERGDFYPFSPIDLVNFLAMARDCAAAQGWPIDEDLNIRHPLFGDIAGRAPARAPKAGDPAPDANA